MLQASGPGARGSVWDGMLRISNTFFREKDPLKTTDIYSSVASPC